MDLKELMETAFDAGIDWGCDEPSTDLFDFKEWYAEKGETLANEYKASRLKPIMEKTNECLEIIKEEMENFAK